VLVTVNVDAGAVRATASERIVARMKLKTNGADSNGPALLVLLLIGNWMREAFIGVWEIFGVGFIAVRRMETDPI
jgi:hypothetical protein